MEITVKNIADEYYMFSCSGFDIIVNLKNSYVNASEICAATGAGINEWARIAILIPLCDPSPPWMTLPEPTDVILGHSGVYIHPDLVHSLVCWGDINRSALVSRMMHFISRRCEIYTSPLLSPEAPEVLEAPRKKQRVAEDLNYLCLFRKPGTTEYKPARCKAKGLKRRTEDLISLGYPDLVYQRVVDCPRSLWRTIVAELPAAVGTSPNSNLIVAGSQEKLVAFVDGIVARC